jgi:hypothetical protein
MPIQARSPEAIIDDYHYSFSWRKGERMSYETLRQALASAIAYAAEEIMPDEGEQMDELELETMERVQEDLLALAERIAEEK